MKIPSHLKKYIVPQNYKKYTAEDQAVWRYLMKRITALQYKHGHQDCIKGMKKTGITFHQIPKISEMDKKLQEFGWRAVSVSGFLPPKAFMDFQAHGILPVASELRALQHISYTPAPDIVHEAVGHAPFLIHPVFSRFLKKYAKVVQKALVSSHDIKIYEAIRHLSDVKENSSSKKTDITKASNRLHTLQKNLSFVSESSRLSRFIWWTSEYGLIGTQKNPKIYGAGLISSFGETEKCFYSKVKKIPLSKDCLNYSYDITSFQPQLFVTPDFEHLLKVLDNISSGLAWQRGGLYGAREALKSQTLNTVELNTGLQISGVLQRQIQFKNQICFLKFKGPSQLSFKGKELPGHGKAYHKEGYSAPLGVMIKTKGLKAGKALNLHFPSGICLRGKVKSKIEKNGKLLLITFIDCLVRKGEDILYRPSWGPFDLAIGQSIVSVFSGAADEKAFGIEDSFNPSLVPLRNHTQEEKFRFKTYRKILSIEREKNFSKKQKSLKNLFSQLRQKTPALWLAGLELLQKSKNFPKIRKEITGWLKKLKTLHPSLKSLIEKGLPFYGD